jgi:hypothetical protein
VAGTAPLRSRLAKACVLLAALAPSAWLAWSYRDLPHLGWYHDDTLYWVSAKSLAEGGGYRIPSLPEQPYQTKYPPLYPLLLAGVWRLFPEFPANLTPALLLNWLWLPPFLLAARRALRDLGLSVQASGGLTALLALSPVTVLLSVTLMSELLFGMLLFTALSLAQRAETGRQAALAGLVGGLAYLTRVAALPLLAAGPLWFLWRRRPRQAALFFAALAPAVAGWAWWARAKLLPSRELVTLYYTDYLGYQLQNISPGDLPMLAWKNLAFLLAAVSQLLTSQAGDFYWRLFALAALAGAVRLARLHGLTPSHLYGVFLLPMVLLCAWPPEARSCVPVLPLLAAGLWCEVSHLLGLLRTAWRKGSRAPALALGGALAASGAAAALFLGLTLFRFLPETLAERRSLLAAQREAYRWIREQTAPGARFAAYDDTVLYLYTGRPAVSLRVPTKLYYEEDGEAFIRLHSRLDEFAGARGLSFLLATQGDYYRGEVPAKFRERARRAAAENYRNERAFARPGVAVYRFRTPASATGLSSAARPESTAWPGAASRRAWR